MRKKTSDQKKMVTAIKDGGKFFTAGFSFVDALKKKPPSDSACWSCGEAPALFFNVAKDCRSLGWSEPGMPAQIYICLGHAVIYMSEFNLMLEQENDDANVRIGE